MRKRIPELMTVIMAVGTALAGILLVETYEGFMSPLHQQESRGQDIITLLIAVPLLATGSFSRIRSKALRLTLESAACGYMLYAYLLYAFGGVTNPLFPFYLAVCALCLNRLLQIHKNPVMVVQHTEMPRGRRMFAAVSFLFFAFALSGLWGVTLAEAIGKSEQPDGLVIIVIDFVVVIPAYILISIGLFRKSIGIPAGILALFSTILGASIIAGQLMAIRHGLHADLAPVLFFSCFTLISTVCVFMLKTKNHKDTSE